MRLGFFLLPMVGSVLSLPYDDSRARPLPPCNADYRPCRCPSGTTFKNLTSYGVIGAPAAEVQNIMGRFLDIQYQGGLIPASTTGKEFTKGATRTFNFSAPAPGEFYQITEVLLDYKSYPDGSFAQKNSQDPSKYSHLDPRMPRSGFLAKMRLTQSATRLETPVVQIPGGGTYRGQWTLILGEQTLVRNETAVAWHNWRCEIGETFPAAQSHENAIFNASAVIAAAGKHTGVDIAPFTIFHDLRQD